MTAPTIARVFPRRTTATPADRLAFVGDPPLYITAPVLRDVGEIHVSCSFTWDRPEAERLARAWSRFGVPVRVGGPAIRPPGACFTPGLYLRPGYVITSRGCPNRCPGCRAPREGGVYTLPIADGWIVQDNNLLACPDDHVAAVFNMLDRQRAPARLTGGLEAGRLKRWHARRIGTLRIESLFLAYDRAAQQQPVAQAVAYLREETGWSQAALLRRVCCYVMVGHDELPTPTHAEPRLQWIRELGITPWPMYYQGEIYRPEPPEWRRYLSPYRRRCAAYADRRADPTAPLFDRHERTTA